MLRHGIVFAQLLKGSIRDLAPIVIVIAVFQFVILQQPLPDLAKMLIGLLFVVFGLTLFVRGLEMGLFPVGEALALIAYPEGKPILDVDIRVRPGLRHNDRRTRAYSG